MRRILAVLALFCALPVVLPASEFDWLVRQFSRESGAKPVRLPLFGLVRFAVRVARPAGATELNLAVFDHMTLDPQRFSSLADETIEGGGWMPIIRVRSRNSESTNVYARHEDGERLRLLIATLDNQDATLVEVRIQTQELINFIDEHHINEHHE